MKAVFLDADTLGDDLDLSALQAAVGHWQAWPETAPQQIASRIAGAEIVITNKVVLDARTLATASELKLICAAATGTDNIDLKAAHQQHITVSNVRGYATASVVQHVFAMLLSLASRLPAQHQAAMDGSWQSARQFCLLDHPINELHGKTLGIVGYGELGQAVATAAQAFGMQVLVAQRPGISPTTGARVPLEKLLPQVDVLSLHCPLTEATRNLMDAHRLALMKPSALLINSARGGLVDEQALAGALREGRLAGAGIDVLSHEPPLADNPLLDRSLKNLIVTPHVAWASHASRQRLVDQLVENIVGYYRGTARNQV